MPESRAVDVVIVGGGIAGPALACALAPTGASILLVERDPAPPDTARGDHLQPRACEWLAEWGVLDTLLELGAERRLGSRYLDPDGALVLHAPVDQLDIPYPWYLYLNHELISAGLLAGAARNPGFELRRPATARLVRGGEDFAVELTGADGDGLVRARLVVAADGRQSRLRRAAGIPAASYAYRNPMLTLMAPRTIADPRNEVRAYFSAAGVLSVIPRTGGGWKLGLPVPPADLPAYRRAQPQELGARLSAWVPELAGVQPVVCGVYPVARIEAARWWERNLVLLGDARHALHPGRSQGMNLALRGVHHLAGLLAAGGLASAAALREALQAHAAALQPAVAARLADNHARGLEMDRLDPAETQAMRDRLAAVAADADRCRAYCRTAAGY